MKAWLNDKVRDLAVALGFIEPPRLQPIPIRAERDRRASLRR